MSKFGARIWNRLWLALACFGLLFAVCACDVLTYPLGGTRFAQRGRELADDSFPSLGVVEARVDSVVAELMLNKTMEARLGDGGVAVDANKPVWVVTVRGHFLFDNGFGGAPMVASQRIFVFDAASGDMIRGQTRP